MAAKENIRIQWPWQLTKKLPSLVAVIDVYAATTNIVYFLSQNPAQLLLANDQKIQILRHQYPNAIIIGESQKQPTNFFDTSNLPRLATAINVTGKTVLYMSNNGTRIIRSVIKQKAKTVIAVSFANISSSANWIKQQRTNKLTIIPAGDKEISNQQSLEDLLCAKALQKLLLKQKIDWNKMLQEVKHFIKDNYPPNYRDADFQTVLARDLFSIVPICWCTKQGIIRIYDANNNIQEA